MKEADCGIVIKNEGTVEFNEVSSSNLPIRLFILIPILTLIFHFWNMTEYNKQKKIQLSEMKKFLK